MVASCEEIETTMCMKTIVALSRENYLSREECGRFVLLLPT